MERSKSRLFIMLIALAVLGGAVAVLLLNRIDGQDVFAAETGSQMESVAGVTLPDSLDDLFPPKAPQPTFLMAMLGMSAAFSGMLADLLEGDIPNVKADYDRFKAEYVRVSELVPPEWKVMFLMDPVEQLGQALASGDPAQVMPAADAVAQVCHSCHTAYMVAVQQKYEWGDFGQISVSDPVTHEDVSYRMLMQGLDVSLSGIMHNVMQSQQANAQKQFEAFSARFKTMRMLTCSHCHTTARKYYVDEEVQAMIDKLGETLNQPSVDAEVVGGLVQQIGMESCHKCHLVHAPAALARH